MPPKLLLLPKGFEVIGDIAIISIPHALEDEKYIIAEAFSYLSAQEWANTVSFLQGVSCFHLILQIIFYFLLNAFDRINRIARILSILFIPS